MPQDGRREGGHILAGGGQPPVQQRQRAEYHDAVPIGPDGESLAHGVIAGECHQAETHDQHGAAMVSGDAVPGGAPDRSAQALPAPGGGSA